MYSMLYATILYDAILYNILGTVEEAEQALAKAYIIYIYIYIYIYI